MIISRPFCFLSLRYSWAVPAEQVCQAHPRKHRNYSIIWIIKATKSSFKNVKCPWFKSPICSFRLWYCCGRGAPNMCNVVIAGALFCAPPNFPLLLTLSPCLVSMVGHWILFCTTCKQQLFLLEEINQSFHRYSNTAAAKPVLPWFHWGASTQYDRFGSLVDTICKGHRWIIGFCWPLEFHSLAAVPLFFFLHWN